MAEDMTSLDVLDKDLTDSCDQYAASMMVSHMQLDEVLANQLNGVVIDTEEAAVRLITQGRKLSDDTQALLHKLDSALSKSSDASSLAQQLSQDLRQLFLTVVEHNNHLAMEIAEMLGQIQFQDVVRQRVERIEQAVNQRNALFQAFVEGVENNGANLEDLPVQMRKVLDDYLAIESMHAQSIDDESTARIELF